MVDGGREANEAKTLRDWVERSNNGGDWIRRSKKVAEALPRRETICFFWVLCRRGKNIYARAWWRNQGGRLG